MKPVTLSSVIENSIFDVIPVPKRFLSVNPPVSKPPDEPKPAPAFIEPVGCSSTERSIDTKLFSS